MDYVPNAEKGIAGGVATLDEAGKIPQDQLPSYVDDVIEYPTRADFPAQGRSGVIYVAIDTGYTYRWAETSYVLIGGKQYEGGYGISVEETVIALDESMRTWEKGDGEGSIQSTGTGCEAKSDYSVAEG